MAVTCTHYLVCIIPSYSHIACRLNNCGNLHPSTQMNHHKKSHPKDQLYHPPIILPSKDYCITYHDLTHQSDCISLSYLQPITRMYRLSKHAHMNITVSLTRSTLMYATASHILLTRINSNESSLIYTPNANHLCQINHLHPNISSDL